MMMTMHPASVVTSSLERGTADRVTAVDPFDMRLLAAELQQQSRDDFICSTAGDDISGRSSRKRLKSTGDTWNVQIESGSSPRDSSKKQSILSLFHIRSHKSKSGKFRLSDAVNGSTAAPAFTLAVDNEAGDDNAVKNGSSSQQPLFSGSAQTADTSPKVAAKTVNSNSSFSQRKGFNRSISIPEAAVLPLVESKKDIANSAAFHPGDGYDDFPCKFECPQTPNNRAALKNQSSVESGGSSSLSEVVQALGGPPLNNTPEILAPTSGNDDRSPLLDRNIAVGTRLAAIAATSFDNIAVIENDVTSCTGSLSVTSSMTSAPDYANGKTGNTSPVSQAAPSLPSNAVGLSLAQSTAPPTSGSSSTSWWKTSGQTNKSSLSTTGVASNVNGVAPGNAVGKKRKPRLSINLPSSSKESGGIRQLSASEERKIDEAIQLASQMATMSTFAAIPSPKSMSASSKESLESPALSSSSSSFFFGGLRRRHPSEKKTFVDGLQATLSVDVAQQIFTADAQAAYNQLVASSPPPGTAGDSMQSKVPSTRRQEFKLHRLQLLESPIPRHPPPIEARRHHQRSSLSESEQVVVNSVNVVPLVLQNVSSTKSRAGSKRSISLSDETTPTAFRIEMTSSAATSESTLSPSASVSGDDSSRSIKITPQNSPEVESDPNRPPSPPPRVPPRVPMRASTINNRPRQRRYQLASSSSVTSKTSSNGGRSPAAVVLNSKQRSASEALPASAGPDVTSRRAVPLPPAPDVELPRRMVKSTAAAVDQRALGTTDDLCGGLHQQRNTSSVGSEPTDISSTNLRSSSSSDDSSVFGSEEDPADKPPSSPAPLPPQCFVGGNPPRSSQGTPFHHQREQQRRTVLPLTSNSSHVDGSRIRKNASQLGFHDARDEFWRYPVDFRLISNAGGSSSTAATRESDVEGQSGNPEMSLSRAEHELLDEMYSPGPAAFRYDTSDAVSYEDLMDFALEGPPQTARKPSVNDGECDEVRLMRKLLTKDITVDECMAALEETHWDIYSAIKLVKLNKLLNIGLANEQLCKMALMSCRWDVEKAAAYLLTSSSNE